MFSYKYDHKLGTFDPVQVYFTERFFFKILFLEGGQQVQRDEVKKAGSEPGKIFIFSAERKSRKSDDNCNARLDGTCYNISFYSSEF